MKIAHIDSKNNILGWYDNNIHKNIPSPNIEVSDEEWKDAITISANCIENGKLIRKDTRTQIEKDKNQEDIEWSEYKRDRDMSERDAWKLAGKPKYKG